jgi:hypothetical protein
MATNLKENDKVLSRLVHLRKVSQKKSLQIARQFYIPWNDDGKLL